MSSSSPLVTIFRSTARRSSVPIRTRPTCSSFIVRRSITATEKPMPKAEKPGKGPNQDQLPHVNEEAGAISEIMGEKTKPEPEEQGTPVQEVLERGGEKAKDNAPQVIQEGMGKSTQGSRSYSTSARRRTELQPILQPIDIMALSGGASVNADDPPAELQSKRHIHGLPTLPLPRALHIKKRDDPLLEQFTRLLMRHGKLARAQRIMAMVLERLRTAPSPNYNTSSSKTLIAGTPPATHLPLNPVLYLNIAVDSIAPLFVLKSFTGLTGGGRTLAIPYPITLKRRRRTSITWILDLASKKDGKGSGRAMFANKLADELISIVEGRSSLWEKRQTLHKLCVANRANIASARKSGY